MMEKYPLVPCLFIIGYLIDKGCCWDSTNASGKKTSDILLAKGFNQDVNVLLDKFAVKTQISVRRASGRKSCMGRADCIHPPAFQLSCPHKPTFLACSKCFAVAMEGARCECADEEVGIFPSNSKSSNPVEALDGLLTKIKEEKEETNNNLSVKKNLSVMEARHSGGKRKADTVPFQGL